MLINHKTILRLLIVATKGLLLLPLVLIALKVWQVWLENGTFDLNTLLMGLLRRVDDASFWMFMAVGFAAFQTTRLAYAYRVNGSASLIAFVSVSILSTTVLYVGLIWNRREAFFYSGHGTIQLVQFIEGGLYLAAIVMGNMALAIGTWMTMKAARDITAPHMRVFGSAATSVMGVYILLVISILLQPLWSALRGGDVTLRFDFLRTAAVVSLFFWPLIPYTLAVISSRGLSQTRLTRTPMRNATDSANGEANHACRRC